MNPTLLLKQRLFAGFNGDSIPSGRFCLCDRHSAPPGVHVLRRLFKPDNSRKSRPPQEPATLVVGLGNPGVKYDQTRHNVGFMVLDRMGSKIDGSSKERFQGAILETRHNDDQLVFLKPLTFMNNSGQSVGEVARWYKIPPERVLVIYDDLDLPFGTIRLRPSGSAGGHNGLSSILDHLGTDAVPRLRIGIGRPTSGSTVNYVLSRFSQDERTALPEIVQTATDAAWMWVDDGIERTMNTFNNPGSARSVRTKPADSAS